jgi:hypothetical protein
MFLLMFISLLWRGNSPRDVMAHLFETSTKVPRS